MIFPFQAPFSSGIFHGTTVPMMDEFWLEATQLTETIHTKIIKNHEKSAAQCLKQTSTVQMQLLLLRILRFCVQQISAVCSSEIPTPQFRSQCNCL